MYLIANIDIIFLRSEPPGSIVTKGDIDNRIKTLIDSLRKPAPSEVPEDDAPKDDEIPYFYCLLEDDSLITSLAVTTDRLLEPVSDPSEVILLIHVHVKVSQATIDNISLGM